METFIPFDIEMNKGQNYVPTDVTTIEMNKEKRLNIPVFSQTLLDDPKMYGYNIENDIYLSPRIFQEKYDLTKAPAIPQPINYY